MNIEEFRQALSSDATEENVRLKKQLLDLQTEYHKELLNLKDENELLKEDCRALCERCYTLTKRDICQICAINYPCPHMPSDDEIVSFVRELRKGDK